MKSKFHPFCLAAPLLFLTGCVNVHWGDYFNAGGGPPEPTSSLPEKSEPVEQPIVEEPGQRRSLR
jgi:hypothetical protein